MDRREFTKKSALLGISSVIIGMPGNSQSAYAVAQPTITKLNDAKKIFREKGACSNTMCFIVNREFDNTNKVYEQATDLLAGGLAQTGHQCGMLWGATIAVGTEAYHRYGSGAGTVGVSLETTQKIVKSFSGCVSTTNCREITGCNFQSKIGMLRYMVKIIVKGMDNSVCFNLAEKWAPEVVSTAKEGLNLKPAYAQPAISCASEVVRRMDGTDAEIHMVSGYAGGLGLSGNACGALAATIWMNMVRWHKDNPDKKAKYFNNPVAKRILRSFYAETNKEILCSNICKQSFSSAKEHTTFIQQGGCTKLIDLLSKA